MFLSFLLFILILLILSHSSLSLYYAFHGLTLWYANMVPALLPYMILSGVIIRMNLISCIMKIIQPVLKLIYRSNMSMNFCIITGFLCGFPMGAKATCDLYAQKNISKKEAEYLLAFCNNFGPVYIISFAIPIIGITDKVLPFLAGYYGIPLLYGFFLRHTIYQKDIRPQEMTIEKHASSPSFLSALNESIKSGIESITLLCGYMVIFNVLNIFIHILFPQYQMHSALLFEITGGLSIAQSMNPSFCMIMLGFGGLCSYAQTYSILCNTDLLFSVYIKHKLITTLFYIVYFLLVFPFL